MSVSSVSSSCLLPLWEALQDQQVGLIQALFKLLFLPWVLEHVRFCVHFLRVESISHSPLALLKLSPAGLPSQTFWGLIFPVQDPWAVESDVGFRYHLLLGENLCNCKSSICGVPTWGYGS